jgi:phosphatidylglycerophosphatase A
MIILLNLTTTKKIEELTYYDDNKDIIWPTIVGIFVALALGWIICRYKCSSQERSPHIVQCCPKSCCTRIRLCCICMFRYFNNTKEIFIFY